MNNLIDLLQYKILEIEGLKGANDFPALQEQVLVLANKIETHSPVRYRKEAQTLRELSQGIWNAVTDERKRTMGAFIKAKNKVLAILDNVLEMED